MIAQVVAVALLASQAFATHSLFRRQGDPLGNIPPQCVDPCTPVAQAIGTGDTPPDLAVLCTVPTFQAIQSCLSCGFDAGAINATTLPSVRESVGLLEAACAANGTPVPNVVLGGEPIPPAGGGAGPSGSAGASAPGGGASATGTSGGAAPSGSSRPSGSAGAGGSSGGAGTGGSATGSAPPASTTKPAGAGALKVQAAGVIAAVLFAGALML